MTRWHFFCLNFTCKINKSKNVSFTIMAYFMTKEREVYLINQKT